MSSFIITQASNDIKLAKGTAKVSFTVTNQTKRDVRGTPQVVKVEEKPFMKDWFSVERGSTARAFAPDGNSTFVVEIKVPPSATPGEYFFKLAIYNEAEPNADFEVGPAVKFKVEPQPVKPDDGKKFPWWILIVLGVLIGGGVAIAILVIPSKVEVPKVVTKSLADASNMLVKAELRLEVTEAIATGTNPIGIVIRQTPPAGDKVVKDAIIDLTVEKELDKINVPDLIGLPPGQLQKVYGNLRIKMVQEKTAHTGTQQPGLISGQRPAAGTPVDPGTEVKFVVEDRKPEDPAPAYVGTWDNENVKSLYVRYFTISWRDKRAYVRVWSRDSVTDWGEKEARVTGGTQLETTWDRGLNVVNLVMNLESGKIRLTSKYSPKVIGPARTIVENFRPRLLHFQIYKPGTAKSLLMVPQLGK